MAGSLLAYHLFLLCREGAGHSATRVFRSVHSGERNILNAIMSFLFCSFLWFLLVVELLKFQMKT